MTNSVWHLANDACFCSCEDGYHAIVSHIGTQALLYKLTADLARERAARVEAERERDEIRESYNRRAANWDVDVADKVEAAEARGPKMGATEGIEELEKLLFERTKAAEARHAVTIYLLREARERDGHALPLTAAWLSAAADLIESPPFDFTALAVEYLTRREEAEWKERQGGYNATPATRREPPASP